MTIATTTQSQTSEATRVTRDHAWFFPAALAFAHLPLLIPHFGNLWTRSHYQYFPAVLAVIGYLLKTRAVRISASEAVPSRVPGLLMLGISIAGIVAATMLVSPWLGAVAAVFAFGGYLLLQREFVFTNSLGIWMLSLLVVPLPVGLDMRLANFLQARTTQISGMLMDLLNVVNVVDGNTIILTTGRLFVEEACSGIVSLMAVIACSVIVAVWMNRPLIHLVVLAVAGIIWAAIMNLVRIVVIAMTQIRGLDLSTGWPHELLGLVLFAITVVLLLSTDRLILFFILPIKGDVRFGRMTNLWNQLFRIGLPVEYQDYADEDSDVSAAGPGIGKRRIVAAGLFVVVGIASAAWLHFAARPNVSLDSVHTAMQTLGESSMPAEVNGWKRTGFRLVENTGKRRVFGNYSIQWIYQKANLTAEFSCDYLFSTEWHELCHCYEATGWERVNRVVYPAVEEGEPSVVRGNFRRPENSGTLHFSMLNSRGQIHGPPDEQSPLELLTRRLRKGTQRLIQVQLWIAEPTPSTTVPATQSQMLFESLRHELQKAYTAKVGANS